MGKTLTPDLVIARSKADNLFMVKNLNLWGNDLEDIKLLRQMPNVEVLSLSVNKISSLKEFANCPKLQELYLRKNNICNLSEIRFLTNLPFLRVLWLWDNPCAETANYREIVIKVLPNLVKLDNNAITPEEKAASQKLNINLDDFKATKEDFEDPPIDEKKMLPMQENPYTSNRNSNYNENNHKEDILQANLEQKEAPIFNRQPSRQNDVPRPNPNQNQYQGIKEKVIPKRDLHHQHSAPYDNYSANNDYHSEPHYQHHHQQQQQQQHQPITQQQQQYPQQKVSDNVMSAALLLIRELDERSLELIKREIDKRLNNLKIGKQFDNLNEFSI